MNKGLNARGSWATRLGFILATSGSAIGLGNIWKFPYVTGQNGGGAFVLVYLACIVLVGFPLMLSEFALGRNTHLNPIGAFKTLKPNPPWGITGFIAITACFLIVSFYGVVGGWTLAYIVKSFTHATLEFGSPAEAEKFFRSFVSNTTEILIYHALFVGICITIVIKGIQSGIEKVCDYLMPTLLLMLIALMVRSLTLPGAMEGVKFYLYPDFSKINPSVILVALGQAFFSLSLGMGIMITYGSYLSDQENLPVCCMYVVLFDTLIALLVGMVIFPAVYSIGLEPTEGPSLVFSVLPTVFSSLPFSGLISVVFFILLAIAAITSGISLLESVVACFIDNLEWPRNKAVLIVGAAIFVFGIPSGLSFGMLSQVKWMDMTFFDHIDNITSNYLLPLGGMMTAIFVGWKWDVKVAQTEITKHGVRFIFSDSWAFIIRYITPALVLLVFLAQFL